MTEQKIDPRIVRTKEAIQRVFKQMVCKMPYEKITVKAISEAAKINRNTFYLHYSSKDDLVSSLVNEVILKHFIDSLTIANLIEKDQKVIDVGTGAGFPGIPLSIVKEENITLLAVTHIRHVTAQYQSQDTDN